MTFPLCPAQASPTERVPSAPNQIHETLLSLLDEQIAIDFNSQEMHVKFTDTLQSVNTFMLSMKSHIRRMEERNEVERACDGRHQSRKLFAVSSSRL